MNNEKPYASLTSLEVEEIIKSLDLKIMSETEKRGCVNINDVEYAISLSKEVAYMECRNLILSKL